MSDDYDVVVIGGGSAGSSAAAAAQREGARTAMVNDGELGGLCILRGCMPTKAMLASAHALHEFAHAERLGLAVEGRLVPEFPRIMQRKDNLVARFKRAKVASIEQGGYDVIPGRGRFSGKGRLEVGDRVLRATSYVIATGSEPVVPAIDGIDQVPVWSSDDVMQLTEQPESLIVQGTGAIGLELAQFFARLGTRVTLVGRSPLLHHLDAVVGDELERVLRDEPNLRLRVPARIERLAPAPGGLSAYIADKNQVHRVEATALLAATGRRAELDDLGLHHIGLAPMESRLAHDSCMRTEQENVFVCGDATGVHQILHLANQEGRIAGFNAAGGEPERQMDYRLRMAVIFTDPPLAHIGVDETTARSTGHDPVVGTARFPETGRAITMGVTHGLWRLIADGASGEILGSTILGPRADDLIHLVALVMSSRMTWRDLPELPWYHPTLSEVMLDVARDIARQTA